MVVMSLLPLLLLTRSTRGMRKQWLRRRAQQVRQQRVTLLPQVSDLQTRLGRKLMSRCEV
jgi:hypothetical protein